MGRDDGEVGGGREGAGADNRTRRQIFTTKTTLKVVED